MALGAARRLRRFGLVAQQLRGGDFPGHVPGYPEKSHGRALTVEDQPSKILHVDDAAVGGVRA